MLKIKYFIDNQWLTLKVPSKLGKDFIYQAPHCRVLYLPNTSLFKKNPILRKVPTQSLVPLFQEYYGYFIYDYITDNFNSLTFNWGSGYFTDSGRSWVDVRKSMRPSKFRIFRHQLKCKIRNLFRKLKAILLNDVEGNLLFSKELPWFLDEEALWSKNKDSASSRE